MFAIVGTLIASLSTSFLLYFCAKIGLSTFTDLTACLIFGALISSTDPVCVLSLFKQMKAD